MPLDCRRCARREISFKGRIGTRGASLEGKIPDEVNWKAHNYNHLLEQPTIFYAIVIALILMGFDAPINVYLAWAYVGFRVAHSLLQATINIVVYRLLLFAGGEFVPARAHVALGDLPHPSRLKQAASSTWVDQRNWPTGSPTRAYSRHRRASGRPRKGRRIAADVGNPAAPWPARFATCSAAPARGGSRIDCIEALELRGIERTPIKIAVFDRMAERRRLSASAASREASAGIGRADRERERAEACEQVGVSSLRR